MTDVLVDPDALIYSFRKLTDLLHASWLVSDQLLQVLLDVEWAFHARDGLLTPAPQVASLGAWAVPTLGDLALVGARARIRSVFK